ALEVPYRVTELPAAAREGEHRIEAALGEAERERADADPPGIQRLHEVDEALAFTAQPVLLRHQCILENELARVGCAPAHLVLLLAGADTGDERLQLGSVADADALRHLTIGRRLRHDEARDAARALAPVRDGGHDENFTDPRVRYEDLA